MFKSRSSSVTSSESAKSKDLKRSSISASISEEVDPPSTNGSLSTTDPSPGSPVSVEVAKEAKEKKDRSSWVKTIGIRTLRMRRSTDSRSSRLSLPGFSSLDRPGKAKKNKDFKEDDLDLKDVKDLKELNSKLGLNNDFSQDIQTATGRSGGGGVLSSIYGKTSGKSKKQEHVKVDKTANSAPTPNKSQEKDREASGPAGENSDKHDPARFLGEGLTFRGKLIGVLEVSGPRGDRICQEALSELKMAVKAAGEHKQKVTVHVALDGLRIRDEKTGDCLYHHQVHKISFIAQDLTDTRAFGYIFGSPDTGHRFFGIKTEKSASQVVIAMRDLFQVVFDLKKKEIERAKQQLELQQKFLATRAQETTPTPHSSYTKPDMKFPIAETYIEGACAASSTIIPPNRTAPEVDLLNLEVELTSLQEGLDSIHHNLGDSTSGPFRGSTSSISSDPINPMPNKRSSVSSSNTNSTTPIPSAFNTFNTSSDPFGDSFDPFSETSGSGSAAIGHNSHQMSTSFNFNLGQSSSQNSRLTSSVHSASAVPFSNHNHQSNSALASPFPADPFAQVDPFPSKFAGDSEFFNSDPFDSPSGPFSFSFPADLGQEVQVVGGKSGEGQGPVQRLGSGGKGKVSFNGGGGRGTSSSPRQGIGQSQGQGQPQTSDTHARYRAEWTASFEDNFVPESEGVGVHQERHDTHIFTELDPLGIGRTRPFVDRKEFFQDIKQVKKLNDHLSSDGPPSYETSNANAKQLMTRSQLEHDPNHQNQLQTQKDSIPTSFSTNFNPPTSSVDFDTHFKTPHHDLRSESPPNYSPPPPPRQTGPTLRSNAHVPFILPPNSPQSSRQKKSEQILKQMTISESSFRTQNSNSSPRTVAKGPLSTSRPGSGRLGKQFNVDLSSNLKDQDVPSLSPPPRPPHNTTQSSAPLKNAIIKGPSSLSSSALPRPTSGSDKGKKTPGNLAFTGNSGMPPEPPPRPMPNSTTSSSHNQMQMQLVSPPPLPPKKQQLANTMSTPLGLKQNQIHSHASARPSVSLHSENDLPLPLPLRKSHISDHSGTSGSALHHQNQTSGGRYAVPEPNSRSAVSHQDPSNIKLSMEQALSQVASMSLGDLAMKLELPVERLSHYTIQQLAHKLTEMDLEKKTVSRKLSSISNVSNVSNNSNLTNPMPHSEFGFDDDFSTASAPTKVNLQKESFDRYAVFRELALEDASGFSVVNNIGSNQGSIGSNASLNSNDDDQSQTLEKTFTSRESSSERTLQADDINDIDLTEQLTEFKTASTASVSQFQNTMDDVTDVNLSDDQDQDFQEFQELQEFQDDGKFPPLSVDEEDNEPQGFVKSEWATFESNFDDRLATTALVKAEDGNESPWESDEGAKLSRNASPNIQPQELSAKIGKDQFDFKPFEKFEKPAELTPKQQQEEEQRLKNRDRDRDPERIERIRSPPSNFQRQSSGSSRHSERSSGGGTVNPGRLSDYSDSGRPELSASGRRRKDYERWEIERDRERESGRGRHDREYRPDSRSSYLSTPRKYRDSEEEYVPSNSMRRSKGSTRIGTSASGRRSKDIDYERENDPEDEEDDRSYASNYSSSGRRHKRYSSKYHQSHYSNRKRNSSDKYSNHESDDESVEDENYSRDRRRDRELYQRERDYYERHHRPRPNSGSGGTSASQKRYHSRDSPRQSDIYYRDHRRDRRDRERLERHKDEEDFGDRDSREISDISGEEGSQHHHHRHGYYGHGHRRIRAKRSSYKERDRDRERGHYYTNSPSWDSESPELPEDKDKVDTISKSSKNPNQNSQKRQERHSRGGSPDHTSSRRDKVSKESGTTNRRYQSELALNSNDSPKLQTFEFDNSNELASSLPMESTSNQNQSRKHSVTSPFQDQQKEGQGQNATGDTPELRKTSLSQSPFEDDFVGQKKSNGGGDQLWDKTLIDPEPGDVIVDDLLDCSPKSIDIATANTANGIDIDETIPAFKDPLDGEPNATTDGDIFPPVNEAKVFTFSGTSGRRLESIKSEEEKSNDDSHSHSHSHNSEGVAVQMKKSDSFNIFKQRADDPFGDDDFFQ